MVKKQADIRDLRVDVSIGENSRYYRVTHIPSSVHIESDTLAEAIAAINQGLESEA